MDGFETSLGVPGMATIEPIHDHHQSGKQRQQKRERKANKGRNARKLLLTDNVILSVNDGQGNKPSETSDDKPPHRGKGDFIDIQA